MAFLPLHRDKEHRFKTGRWTWSEHEAKLKFHSHKPADNDDKKTKNHSRAVDAGLKFAEHIDVADEKIFHEIFLRPGSFYDSDVVTVQDIKNLALFTMKAKVERRFIDFLHSETFDKFMQSTIFYIDKFLMVLELLLIRRDMEAAGQIRDTFSIKAEQFMSRQLSDRRALIAREYSKVSPRPHQFSLIRFPTSFQILLMCNKEVSSKSRFEVRPTVGKDLQFFESLIDFTIQCTFIALHRRAFNTICEYQFRFGFEFLAFSQFFLCRCSLTM